MSRRLCLITGASAGIGAAMARTFAKAGYDVALTARRTDRLEALADEIRLRFGVETFVIAADLAQPEAAWPGRAGKSTQDWAYPSQRKPSPPPMG